MHARSVFHNSLRTGLILFSFAVIASAQEIDTLRLGQNVIPRKQNIHLNLDPNKDDYSGTVDIALDVRSETHIIRLHAKDLKITKVSFLHNGKKIPVQWHLASGNLLYVRSIKPIPPGDYSMHIEFNCRFLDQGNGLFKSIEKENVYLATQFEPTHARSAFPCWDEPGFKCQFQVTLSVPNGMAAFSNTPIEKEIQSGKVRTVVFEKTPPLPVYLVAFAVGPFEKVPILGMSVPGAVVVPKGQSKLTAEVVAAVPLILIELEKRYGPYPFPKLDLIALPGLMGAMENAGLVTFNQNFLLTDPLVCTTDQRLWKMIIISHELAHMWFGDLVTMAWWDEAWLNEGFATWIGIDVTNTLFPQYNAFAEGSRSAQHAMSTDALPSASAVRRTILANDDPWQAFDELSYQKGGAILAMVSAWTGEENFRNGLVDYLGKNKWRTASASDLWPSLSTLASEPVDSIVASFIDQPGMPIVEAELLSGPKLKLLQSRFINYGFTAHTQQWEIPIMLKYSDGSTIYQQQLVLKKECEIISLKCSGMPKWLHLNAGEYGYYRWLVPDSMLLTLAANSTQCMNSRERIGFLYNAKALLYGGRLHGDTYLKIVQKFADDADPEVLKVVGSPIEEIYSLFLAPENERFLTTYVRKTCGIVLSRIGREKQPAESSNVSALRTLTMSLLAEQGKDTGIQQYCDSLCNVYLKKSDAVDPELVDTALRTAARNGSEELYNEFLKRFKSASSIDDKNRFAYLLGAFQNRAILQQTLNYLSTATLNQEDFITILFGTLSQKNNAIILDWILSNYQSITTKVDPRMLSYAIPYIVLAPSDSLLTKATLFFSEPSHKQQMMDIGLKKSADKVLTMMRIREKESLAVNRFLNP